MAELDLISVAHVYKREAEVDLITSPLTLIPEIQTSHVGEVQSIYISNIDGENDDSVTLWKVDNTTSPTIQNEFIKTIVVPKDASLVVVSKAAPINLTEGQSIEAAAGTSGRLRGFANWTDMS